MKIRTYIAAQELTMKEFARKVRYSEEHLRRVIRGSRKPSWKFVEDVLRVTNGYVTEEEIVHIRRVRTQEPKADSSK